MLSPNCGVQNKQCKREKTVRKECWLAGMGWLFDYLTHGKPSKQHFLLHFITTYCVPLPLLLTHSYMLEPFAQGCVQANGFG